MRDIFKIPLNYIFNGSLSHIAHLYIICIIELLKQFLCLWWKNIILNTLFLINIPVRMSYASIFDIIYPNMYKVCAKGFLNDLFPRCVFKWGCKARFRFLHKAAIKQNFLWTSVRSSGKDRDYAMVTVTRQERVCKLWWCDLNLRKTKVLNWLSLFFWHGNRQSSVRGKSTTKCFLFESWVLLERHIITDVALFCFV